MEKGKRTDRVEEKVEERAPTARYMQLFREFLAIVQDDDGIMVKLEDYALKLKSEHNQEAYPNHPQ